MFFRFYDFKTAIVSHTPTKPPFDLNSFSFSMSLYLCKGKKSVFRADGRSLNLYEEWRIKGRDITMNERMAAVEQTNR